MPNGVGITEQMEQMLRDLYWMRVRSEETARRVELFNEMVAFLRATGLMSAANNMAEARDFAVAEASRINRDLRLLENRLSEAELSIRVEARDSMRRAGVSPRVIEERITLLTRTFDLIRGTQITLGDASGLESSRSNLALRNQDAKRIMETQTNQSLKAQEAESLASQYRVVAETGVRLMLQMEAEALNARFNNLNNVRQQAVTAFTSSRMLLTEEIAVAGEASPLRAALSGPLARGDAEFIRARILGRGLDVPVFTTEIRVAIRQLRGQRLRQFPIQRGAPRVP